MKKPFSLVLDADGVLLDFNSAFCRHIKHVDSHGEPREVRDYDYKAVLGSTDNLVHKLQSFIGSEPWRHLMPLCDIRALEAARNAGIELHVVTQITDARCRAPRIMNLTERYGALFNSVRFTSHNQSKIAHYEDIAADTRCLGIVEDRPATLREFAAAGHPVFAVVHDYNEKEVESMQGTELGVTPYYRTQDAVYAGILATL